MEPPDHPQGAYSPQKKNPAFINKLFYDFYIFSLKITSPPPHFENNLSPPNRLSSTIGGNREMIQLYTTSQVSNITNKTKFSHIS